MTSIVETCRNKFVYLNCFILSLSSVCNFKFIFRKAERLTRKCVHLNNGINIYLSIRFYIFIMNIYIYVYIVLNIPKGFQHSYRIAIVFSSNQLVNDTFSIFYVTYVLSVVCSPINKL